MRQLRGHVAVADKVSQLVSDPRWEVWGRHVEAIKDYYAKRQAVAAAKLLTETLSGDEYVKAKVAHASSLEAVKVLDYALNMAKTLIEQGEKALAELRQYDKDIH